MGGTPLWGADHAGVSLLIAVGIIVYVLVFKKYLQSLGEISFNSCFIMFYNRFQHLYWQGIDMIEVELKRR